MVAIAALHAIPWHSSQSLGNGRGRRTIWASAAPDSPQKPGTLAIEEEEVVENVEKEVDYTGSGCKTCGRSEVMWGCNGLGRIQGGIAAVPGFGWWPIKAFRPCPAFVESGGRYKRQGQRLDEFAYGRRFSKSEKEASRPTSDTPRKKTTKKRN